MNVPRFFNQAVQPLGAILVGLSCYAAGAWWMARAESISMPQFEDVVRRYDKGIFMVHYQYAYAPLDDALERSVARYGLYKDEPATTQMSLARLHQEVLKGDLVNVMVLPPGRREMDEGLVPIDIPLDEGFWGYHVGFIRAADQTLIDKVRDIAGMRQLRLGDRQQLINAPIYEYNGIPVAVDAGDYDSLVQMLQRGRFDLISRPAATAVDEFETYVEKYPDLKIDQHLLIHFPSALYVYVSKSAPHLAERIRYGLQEMQKDGSLKRHFEKYLFPAVAKLNFPERTVIELKNPLLPAWTKIPILEWR